MYALEPNKKDQFDYILHWSVYVHVNCIVVIIINSWNFMESKGNNVVVFYSYSRLFVAFACNPHPQAVNQTERTGIRAKWDCGKHGNIWNSVILLS